MRHPFLLVLFLLAPLALLHCAQDVAELRSDAEQGDAKAQYSLGFLYSKGQGVPQDYVTAYAWFNLATALGHAEARNSRDIVAEKLDTVSIARAQKLSDEYFKRYVEPFQ